MPHPPSVTIGLLGGVASGKSLVADLLAERGAVVLAADSVAHTVLVEPPVREALIARWGEGILTPSGEIDRRQVAQRVFGESPQAIADRRFLEQLVHPRTRWRLEQLREHQLQQGARVFVIDAPLLLEAGWDSACDWILFVETPIERRRAYAAQRGWEEGELERREQAQLAIELKRARADWVIDNSQDLSSLRLQVEEFCQRAFPTA